MSFVPNTVTIRRTTEDDIPYLASIISENLDKETSEHFCDEVALSFSANLAKPWFYTARDIGTGRPLGCAAYGTAWISYGSYAIFWVNVDKRFRNRGIGKALVSRCLEDLSARASLVLLKTDIPGYYSKHWKFATLLNNIEGVGDDNVLMGLKF